MHQLTLFCSIWHVPDNSLSSAWLYLLIERYNHTIDLSTTTLTIKVDQLRLLAKWYLLSLGVNGLISISVSIGSWGKCGYGNSSHDCEQFIGDFHSTLHATSGIGDQLIRKCGIVINSAATSSYTNSSYTSYSRLYSKSSEQR